MDINKANEAVSGGPGVLELGGTTYLVGQPDDRTFRTLLAHLRSKIKTPLTAVAEELAAMPPEMRALVQSGAISEAVKIKAGGGVELTQSYVQEELMKPAGAAFLAWLLIRKEQPDAKLAEIEPHVTDDNVVEVLAKLMTASGLEAVIAGKVGVTGS
jgi:hypothetical protein